MRSEKVQQAIREARERPNRKAKTLESDTHLPADDVEKKTASMTSPPKPPRVYTYTEEVGPESQGEPQETKAERQIDPEKTGNENETEEEPLNSQGDGENEPNSSLQQNPFKLTLKRKETVPHAVVKPLSSTTSMSNNMFCMSPSRLAVYLLNSSLALNCFQRSSDKVLKAFR